jgi:MATE family multidrug resistance protein
VWLGAAVIPLFLLVIPFASLIFEFAGHDPEVIPYEAVYFQVLALGAGATVIGAAQSAFYTGRGVTWVVMIVDVAMVALNIVLDALLIFGIGGWLRWGIAGAALATVICQWLKVAVYWWLIRRPKNRERYGIVAGRRLDLNLMRRLWRFGGPSGLQFLLEGAGFTLIVMFMGQLDKNSLVATTMAFQINMLAFVPLIGVGIAVSTLVGQQLTGGSAHLAARATWTAFWIGLAYTCVFGVAYVALPDVFLIGNAVGSDAAQFAEIRGLVAVLLRFVAAYCIFDAIQIVFSCAIKGAGDTRFVLATTAVVSLLGVTIGQIGARLGGGLYWWWLVVTGWIMVLGVVYLARFLQGKWRSMRVIETDPTEIEQEPFPEPEPQLAAASAEAGEC